MSQEMRGLSIEICKQRPMYGGQNYKRRIKKNAKSGKLLKLNRLHW